MLVRIRFFEMSAGCLLIACMASSARAQQSLPSGAVRSHYLQPGAPIAQPSPQYAPAYRANPTISPIAHEEPATLAPRPLSPAPIPLSPRGAPAGKALLRTPATGWGAVSSVGASLGLVLGAFLCVAWLSKRYLPKTAGPLPKEVVEQLGWAPLAGRQQMQLLRLGNKLLLIAVTPGGKAEPLGEVTDQAEVERLSAICRRAKPESATHAFRQVMNELERQPARGFVETQPRTTAPARPTTGRPTHG